MYYAGWFYRCTAPRTAGDIVAAKRPMIPSVLLGVSPARFRVKGKFSVYYCTNAVLYLRVRATQVTVDLI
jgi:hypothetical protein